MAFSLNKVMLIGNLGKDCETRFTNNDLTVTTFNLATTHSYKKDNNWENITTWHNIVAFSLSDYYKDILKKGAKVYVEGRINKRDYTDKDSIKRYITEIIAEKIIPLDKKEATSSFNETGSSKDGISDFIDKVEDTPMEHLAKRTEISNDVEPQVDNNDDLPF